MLRSMRLMLVLAVLLAAAGCARGHDTGDVRTVTVGGLDRTFRWFLPPDLPGTPVPLVVMLHGGFGSGEQAQQDYGWDTVAAAHGFAVVYPDGVDRAWNAGGGCCGRAGRDGVDDVAFVRAVVDAVAAHRPIDRRRVYATGISNGGMLAYRLACDTDLFAAIAPDSATRLGDCPHPARTSVLHLHGTADTRVRFGGGPGEGIAGIDGPPVTAVVDGWRAVDGCDPAVTTVAGPVTTARSACPDGREVELRTIDGAGHQWPGAAQKRVRQLAGADPPSTALDATAVIWEFFSRLPAAS